MDFFRREILGRGQQASVRDEEQVESPPAAQPRPVDPLQNDHRPVTSASERTRRFSLARPTLPYLLRGRANTEATQQPTIPQPEMRDHPDIDSPKTPTNRYTLTLSNFSTSRLDLPHLRSPTSTNGFRSPTLPQHNVQSPTLSTHLRSPTAPSLSSYSVPTERPRSRTSRLSDAPAYPSDEVTDDPVIARPSPAVTSERRRTIRFQGIGPNDSRSSEEDAPQALTEEGTGEGRRSGSRRHKRRKKRRRHRHHDTSSPRHGEHGRSRDETSRPKPPKRFLFCFPWIKSQKIRNQILTCFVSGMFLVLMLAVYLALTLTHQISSSQFAILIILIILFTTIIFCHALIRLCLYVVKPPREDVVDRSQMSHFVTPGGYAIPRRPIRVVLTRDEEAAGINSETVNTKPPAYGLWRESVRVDPNRIYWQRADEAEGTESTTAASSSGANGSGGGSGSGSGSATGSTGGSAERSDSPRPPSYVSDDGVDYVVEARPRSMAPTTDVPLPPHPSEAARLRGQPAAW